MYFAALDESRAGLISLRWMSPALDYLDYLFRGFYLVSRRLSARITCQCRRASIGYVVCVVRVSLGPVKVCKNSQGVRALRIVDFYVFTSSSRWVFRAAHTPQSVGSGWLRWRLDLRPG